jgi:diguanylate cyclase (GGDEF)-like protein/PAS domain S-box-containing protein
MVKVILKKAKPKSQAVERRKRAKRRSDDRLPNFRDLIENSVQGIVVHRNFKPLYANKAFATLFGYASPDDIMKLPLLRPLVPADMWARIEQQYDELLRGTRKSGISRARALKKDGQEIWTASTERLINWHGEPAVQINVYDITQQMVIEQSLLKSEQHLRAVLEILPYPIYIASRADGQLLFVNRKSCLLFQQSASQLLRSKSSDFFINPKERDELRSLLDTIPDIRDVEVKLRSAQGREFTAEIAAIATDYGGTPAVLVALNDVSQRKDLEKELLRQASTDSLTGVNNRRYFLAQAEQELRRSRRFARTMSVMMIDVDHFKKINDEHGHAAGDAVLQGVVKRALESLRQSDTLGRLGGEEFAVLLPETAIADAVDVAERLRQHLAERPLIAERAAIPCTASIGVAQLCAKDGTIEVLLQRADEALYLAKKNGRNRVQIASLSATK